MSHTVKVRVEVRDHAALAAAARAMGGTVLGGGTHQLYQGPVDGFAVQLPGWKYPVVAVNGTDLVYDNYEGRWGSQADIDRLLRDYAVEAAVSAAEAQGWYVERTDQGATVYHPAGGTLDVTADGVTAAGFSGGGCQAPTEYLAGAMGEGEGRHLPEFFEAHQETRQVRGD